jgi:imidazole glycerol-phosphate synthase subunit HisF
MLRTRVMPCLLLRNAGLVKTVRFRDPTYVGDPVNAVRIYNEKEVDELIFLDITATPERKRPPFELIGQIAAECFMPFTYGGGVREIEDVQEILRLGVEKVAVNTFAIEDPGFVGRVAERFGSQSVVVSIDARRRWLRGYEVFTHGGRRATGVHPADHARRVAEAGAGEILLTSIDRDGTMEGYDLELLRMVADAVTVPVIACGGAGRLEHFREAVRDGRADAVAAGSMVVFQGRARGVLISFPTPLELEQALG